MPKAKTIPSTELATSSKARAPAKPKPPPKPSKPPASDSSTWRNSTLPANRKISASDAKARYKLTAKDLRQLPMPIHQPTGYTLVKTGSKIVTHMYQERAVEYLAWQKHGSPERFDFYINWLSRRKKPMKTAVNEGPSIGTSGSLPNSSWTATPGLRELKAQFPADWLWEACNKALQTDDDEYGDLRPSERQAALATVFRHPNRPCIGPYPARPISSLPSSSNSANALRSVLENASGAIDGDMDGFTGEITRFWTVHYRESLFRALIGVIDEHGCEGWKNARWLVYDKYAECVAGIYRHRDGNNDYWWVDEAAVWLQGQLDTSIHDYRQTRGDCEGGREYNSMLPLHVDGV